jgi:hypothetical protein
VGLDLHPWVHPHLTRGGSGRGCRFQSAPPGPHWASVYSPCTTILGLETRPKTRGHSMADALSKPAGTRNPSGAGAGAVFHPRVQVRVFTHQHFGAGRVFGQPAPNPPRCHPYIYVLKVFDLQRDTSSGEEFTQTVLNPDEGGAEHNDPME